MNKAVQITNPTQMCTQLLGYNHCTPFYSLQNCTLFSPYLFIDTQTHTHTEADDARFSLF